VESFSSIHAKYSRGLAQFRGPPCLTSAEPALYPRFLGSMAEPPDFHVSPLASNLAEAPEVPLANAVAGVSQ
jgi:hypothetical protein